VDPDPAAVAQVAARAGITARFASIDALVKETAVDAVVLATPPHFLYETALVALAAGKHVLAEKPIGIDEKEAAQLEEAVARAGVCYMAGYSFRFCAALQQVQALLRAGAIGELVSVMGSIGVAPMPSGWFASPATGGGPLLYVGSHLVDEILWFVQASPSEVTARIRYRNDTHADETATFQMRFANGITAQCLVTQAADGFLNNLDLYGRAGRISLRGVDYLNYAVEVVSEVLPAYAQPTHIRPRIWGDPKMAMLSAELDAFAQAIHTQSPPPITVSDGRRVLQVLDAVIQSERSGERVRLG
jgi:predicted dehydrogenase